MMVHKTTWHDFSESSANLRINVIKECHFLFTHSFIAKGVMTFPFSGRIAEVRVEGFDDSGLSADFRP